MEISLQWLSTKRFLDSCFRSRYLVCLQLPRSCVCSPVFVDEEKEGRNLNCSREFDDENDDVFVWSGTARFKKYIWMQFVISRIFLSASSTIFIFMNDSYAVERQPRQLLICHWLNIFHFWHKTLSSALFFILNFFLVNELNFSFFSSFLHNSIHIILLLLSIKQHESFYPTI